MIITKENKSLLITFSYLLLFYLALNLIPYEKFSSYEWVTILIKVMFFAALVILCIYEILHIKYQLGKKEKYISTFYYFPLFIGCCSNWIYALICSKQPNISIDVTMFSLTAIQSAFSVAIEEMIFRGIFLVFWSQSLKETKYKNVLAILFTSIAFSLMHVINFYGNNPIAVLGQIGYTFVLGMILGVIGFTCKYQIIIPFIAHFLFNFFNQIVYSSFYKTEYSMNYWIVSASVAAFCIVYTLFVYYMFYRKKENKDNAS